MKKYLLYLAMACMVVAVPVIQTGCKTAPDARHVQYTTLKAVGQTADAAVALSAHLYEQGTISAAQANKVRVIYDGRFSPAYKVAVNAARADLSSIASDDIIKIATELAQLVASYQSQ